MSKNIFLCYRQTDSEIVERAKGDLTRHGFDAWSYADVKPAQSWRITMNQALLEAETVIVFLSPAFIENEICRQQVYIAQSLQKRIIPVLAQPCFDLLDGVDEFSQLKGLQIIPFALTQEKGLADEYDAVFPQLLDAVRPNTRFVPLNARHNHVAFYKFDTDFVVKLCDDLGKAGIDTWSAATTLRGGDPWRRVLAESVLTSSNLVLVLSVESIQSYWVRREIILAGLKGIPIIPIIPPRVLGGSSYSQKYPELRDAASAIYEMSPINDLSWIYPEPDYAKALHDLIAALAPSDQEKSKKQGIFLSYRRAESRDFTGRMYDFLITEFGAEFVFQDVGSIEGGQNFVDALHLALDASAVMLVVIGPNWATVTDKTGNSRLQDPDDFVRLEVETALNRADMVVIPVLLDNTLMPTKSDLPECLHPLVYRQGIQVRTEKGFRGDMSLLVQQIRRSQSTP